MRISWQKIFERPWLIIFGLIIISGLLHFWLINQLHIVEDESAYLQDAAQLRWNFLPFREYGATKGPLYLVLLKIWELLFPPTIMAGRLFSVIAHTISIPIFYLFAVRLSQQRPLALIACVWWALSPVVVSLTTNAMHFPWELLLILSCLSLLASPTYTRRTIVFAASLFCLALLIRVSAVAFGPAILFLLVYRTRSWRAPSYFAVLVVVGLGIIFIAMFPLYGWPKIAFFFNIENVLIASQQREAYQSQAGATPIFQQLFRAALPLWRDGLPLLLCALLVPFTWRPRSQAIRLCLTMILTILAVALSRALVTDDYYADSPTRTAIMQLCLAAWLLLGGATIFHPSPLMIRNRPIFWLVIIWVSGFIVFYRGWGRTPTPFYPLESLPALALAAGVVVTYFVARLQQLPRWQGQFWGVSGMVLVVVSLGTAFWYAPQEQYRGTVEVAAAQTTAMHIRRLVPSGEPLFTAQPVFAYLSEHPLFLGLTHPGWYLSERVGTVPTEIRQVFFPDFEVLAARVAKDVNWIVVDWRTNDVYFNGGAQQTKPFRELLENDFEAIVTVPNPASRDIILYRRRNIAE